MCSAATPAALGLELAHLVGSELADGGHAVGVAATVQLAHALDFGLVGRKDN